MIESIKRFFQEELWNFPLNREKGMRRFAYRLLRMGSLSVRRFIQDKCSLSASSLTYYTLMSIVPVLAMSLAIVSGFGFNEYFRQQILISFKDQNTALVELFKYSDKFLEEARGGVVAGVGLVILFWTVCLLLNGLESILNHIWRVKKSRSWQRIASDYFALMLLGPILFILFSSIAVWGKLPFLPYLLFWFLFTFFYLFMPNTKVRFQSALIGGFFGGILFVVVQWFYIAFQVGVSRYGAVYGSMAALPLFLIWVQLSWFLFLFGAEISYAHQTLDEHEYELPASRISHNFKRLVSLWIVHLVVLRYQKNEAPLSRETLIQKYQLPIALIRPIIRELEEAHLLISTPAGYLPARPSEQLRISDVLEALDARGIDAFPFLESKDLAPFEQILDQFRKQIEESPENRLLSHVSYPI